MVTHGTLGKSCVIDVCYSCGGKFLDGGDLIKIRNEYNNEQERSKAFADLLFNKYSVSDIDRLIAKIENM